VNLSRRRIPIGAGGTGSYAPYLMRHALPDLCRALVVILYKQNQLHAPPGTPASDARTLGTRLAPHSACILSCETPSICGMVKASSKDF
jgi:hypothetical protein